MEIDWTNGKRIDLKHNESIADVKREFPNYKYAVVMENNYQNGTNEKTRWLRMDYEDAIDDCIGCCMAENQAYVYDLQKDSICQISKEEHDKSWRRITSIENSTQNFTDNENGVDISLKALQEYADKNGIKKMVKDMNFREIESIRISKIMEELTTDERK